MTNHLLRGTEKTLFLTRAPGRESQCELAGSALLYS